MPTNDQIEELINYPNMTSTWTTQDGVNGILSTSKKDTSKSIFIPAAGAALNGSIIQSGNAVGSWINQLSSNDNGCCLYGNSDVGGVDGLPRYCGCSIRGVIG